MTSQATFVDTNVLLRYLTNDVPQQAELVEELLGLAESGHLQLMTNSLVIAELVWTLESFYGLGREDIRDKVLAILNTPGLELPDADVVLQGIVWFADNNVDYADAFNAAWLLRQGLSRACTFDRKHFSRFDGIDVGTPGEAASPG